jgi:hypothetical protein
MGDSHMTVMTDVERLTTPHRHDLDPCRRGFPVSFEVRELADMVAFNGPRFAAKLAFLVEQPLNPLIPVDARSLIGDAVSDNGYFASYHWKSPKASDTWGFLLALDADFQTRA